MWCQAASVCSLYLFYFIFLFLEALRAMSFPLRNAFIVSHKFGYVFASFSLSSKKSLISFFIHFLTKVSLRRVLFSFHLNVDFLLFMLLLKISLIPWWSDKMHVTISIFFYLLRPVFTNDMVKIGEGTIRCWKSYIILF